MFQFRIVQNNDRVSIFVYQMSDKGPPMEVTFRDGIPTMMSSVVSMEGTLGPLLWWDTDSAVSILDALYAEIGRFLNKPKRETAGGVESIEYVRGKLASTEANLAYLQDLVKGLLSEPMPAKGKKIQAQARRYVDALGWPIKTKPKTPRPKPLSFSDKWESLVANLATLPILAEAGERAIDLSVEADDVGR